MQTPATRRHPPRPEPAPEDARCAVAVGAGLVCMDEHGRILLVKPAREPRWAVPGAVRAAAESPRETAARAVLESLGLSRDPGRLLCVDYVPEASAGAAPGIAYLFDGGVLSARESAAVKLAADEFADLRFADAASLPDFLGGVLLRRIRAGLGAQHSGVPVDLEDGFPR